MHNGANPHKQREIARLFNQGVEAEVISRMLGIHMEVVEKFHPDYVAKVKKRLQKEAIEAEQADIAQRQAAAVTTQALQDLLVQTKPAPKKIKE